MCSSTGGIQTATLQTGLEYPKGLWIKDGFVYFTETAGRNTSCGGRVRLLRSLVDGTGFEVLLDNPEISDGVVVDDEGKIYLTSYKDVTPGQNGDVSVVEFFEGEGWQENQAPRSSKLGLDVPRA